MLSWARPKSQLLSWTQPKGQPGLRLVPDMMTESLSGRLALVTGARQGLGFHIARGLGQRGAAVLLNGRDAEGLRPSVEELRAEGIDAAPAVFYIPDLA